MELLLRFDFGNGIDFVLLLLMFALCLGGFYRIQFLATNIKSNVLCWNRRKNKQT